MKVDFSELSLPITTHHLLEAGKEGQVFQVCWASWGPHAFLVTPSIGLGFSMTQVTYFFSHVPSLMGGLDTLLGFSVSQGFPSDLAAGTLDAFLPQG